MEDESRRVARDAMGGVSSTPPAPNLPFRNVQRFRGGLVFKAHRLLYHSTLGLRIIKKREEKLGFEESRRVARAARGGCFFSGQLGR